MRESLTVFAIAVILVLSALLVGPYLVNWNSQRDWLAAKLSQTIGARVKIAGPIDVKLLPRPIFRVSQVSIDGMTRRDPRFSAARLDAELSINSLLQGAVEFVDAEVASPRIEVTVRTDGSLVAPGWDVSNPQKFMFKHVIVRDGTIAIKDESGHQRFALTGISALGEADSLFGPLKVSGEAQGLAKPFKFRLNTGAYAARRLRIKILAEALGSLSRADVDGLVTIGSTTAPANAHAPLGFRGSVNLSGDVHIADGAAPVPWQVAAADVKADAKGLTTTAVELRAGTDNRALIANGGGLVDFGDAPSAILKLRARQLDLDRIAVPPDIAPDTPRPNPAQWLAALQGVIGQNDPSAALPVRLSLTYAIDAITTGDLTLTEAAGDIEAAKGLPFRGRFSLNAPSGSRIALDGSLEPGTAAVFKGRVDAATRDLASVAGWLTPAFPEAADWVKRNVPIQAVSLSSDLNLSKTGFAARDMALTVDGSSLNGSLALTSGVGEERPRLFADLTADTLDTEHLPNIGDLATAMSPLDLSLGISAKVLKLSRTGVGVVETGRLAFHVSKAKDAVTLDEFSVAGLGGATVTATASLDADKLIQTRGHIEASDLAPLAAMVRQFVPNDATNIIATRAALLSPLSLDFKAQGTLGADALPSPTLATATGTLGATRLSATITPEPAQKFGTSSLNAFVVLDAPNAGAMLRQWGLEAPSLGLLGTGHVELTARGTPETGFDTHVIANVADAKLLFGGLIDKKTGTGHLKATGANAAPLLKAAAIAAPPAAAIWPWEIDTDLGWNDEHTTASKLSGRFNGTPLSGSLAYTYEPAPTNGRSAPALTGSLTLDALPLSGITGLVLGAPAPPPAGRWWAETRFAPVPTELPRADLTLHISSLGLTDTLAARNTALDLKLAAGSVTLENLSGEIFGGKAGGTFTLRRDGGAASLTGQARFSNLALDLPSLAGRLSGSLSVAGSGSSPDALVGSLAGDGSLTIAGARTPRLDPQALTFVAKAYDAEGTTIDDGAIRDTLTKALDRGALGLGDVSTPATLAAGTLRAVGLQSHGPTFTANTEVSFDLRTFAFTLRTILTVSELPKDWKGDPPQVTVTWRGPLANPSREVDSAAFVNGLAARAIARDQERIQLMQDDLRERAFFARRLKAIEVEQQAVRDAAQAARDAALAAKLPPPGPKGPDIRLPRPPDVIQPSATLGLRPTDGLSKQFPTVQSVPLPPAKPPARPSTIPSKPVELQQSPQALEPNSGGPNMADPTAAGRY